jgi:hypothetical protein
MHGLQRLAPMPPPLCNHRGFFQGALARPPGMSPRRPRRSGWLRLARPGTHRHRVRMTTTPEPGRLPSARLRPHGRSRPDCAHCYTCTFQPRTLSLATNRPGPVKGAAVASNYPSRRHDPCGSRRHYGEDASHRCLQSTDDTSTLRTVRFPASPPQALRPASCAHPRPEPRASPGWSIA